MRRSKNSLASAARTHLSQRYLSLLLLSLLWLNLSQQ